MWRLDLPQESCSEDYPQAAGVMLEAENRAAALGQLPRKPEKSGVFVGVCASMTSQSARCCRSSRRRSSTALIRGFPPMESPIKRPVSAAIGPNPATFVQKYNLRA